MSGPVHGAADLPGVTVDGYNAELRDQVGGFAGDRASSSAFRSILNEVRDRFADGDDPLGDVAASSKQRLDAMLARGDPEAAGVIVGAIEAWAHRFAAVIQRFLRLPEWRGTQRIAVGGGLRGSRVGEIAIGRTMVLLRGAGQEIGLLPIRHDPDEAGLLGAAHLFPRDWLAQGDSLLAADIGGTNIRAGVVALASAADLSEASVALSEQWRHGEDEPTRDAAVERLAAMLGELAAQAEAKGLHPARLVGIGCPGAIRADGRIERGGQNLPGDWEEPGFNLPARIADALPGWRVMLHNDAVVQGLSQAPWMRDVQRWGVMTAGTGLGNARFTNRADQAPA